MKNFKKILMPAFALLALGFSSCNSDDEYFDEKYQDEPITVTKVFLEDPKSSVKDREVDYARLGQMIRLEGSGFMGLKKLYVNGYETYFNRAYVTDRSMLVTLNAKTPITDAEEDVRNTIRLVKDNTEYKFDFTIRAASPTITGFVCSLPTAGETVKAIGTGLQEITSITLPGGVEVTEGIVSDEDGEYFTFTMPQGVTEGGSILATGANGIAQSPNYFNFNECYVINYDGLGVQGAWGSDNKDDDGNIKAGVSMIYPEDLVDDPLASGRGKSLQLVPERLLAEGGIAQGKPRACEAWTAGNDDEADDWTRMTQYIDATAPLTEVAFQFDFYCPDPWNLTGQIEVCVINNYNFSGKGTDDDNKQCMTAFYIPWANADGTTTAYQNDGWTTVTIPFSEFGKFKALVEDTEAQMPVFQDLIDARNAASYRNFGIGFVNTDFKIGDFEFKSSAFSDVHMYIDNLRVVPFETFEISDYPEDEEE